MVGIAPALVAAGSFAVFQVVNRRALSGVDVYRGTASLLAVGALVLGAVALAGGGAGAVAAAPPAALAACVAAGLVHFLCGWTLLGICQLRIGAVQAGIVVGTLPLFGALVAAVALAEPVGAVGVLGLVLTVGGVAIVLTARGGQVPGTRGRAAVGVVAGLATAWCWSLSPVLIRRGLEGVGSPVAAAAVGMAASALLYAVLVGLTRHRARRTPVAGGTRRLLVAAGVAVAVAIWMQWTAYGLAPIAVVLALLQLTPPLVVLLASWLGRERLGPAAWRVWAGTAVTVAGSLVLVLGG